MTETAMTTGMTKYLNGLPFAPIKRIAATCLAVATNLDPVTSGRPWAIPSDGYVYRLHDIEPRSEGFRELNEAMKLEFAVPAKL